MQVTIINM